MSAATMVPETWELSGDDARETLKRTGRMRLVRDAFVRFRASDGFSHARSLAFVTSLLLVQGVIVLVGVAAALGDTDLSASIVRAITEAVPGPAGKALTNAVFHAYRTGASGQYVVLVVIGVTSLIIGTTLMGQIERALNRQNFRYELVHLLTGGDALAFFRRQGVYATAAVPNLILVDLNLSKYTGEDILQEIQSAPHVAGVPVCVWSSSQSLRDEAILKNFAVARFITKPTGLNQFMEIGKIIKDMVAGSTPV